MTYCLFLEFFNGTRVAQELASHYLYNHIGAEIFWVVVYKYLESSKEKKPPIGTLLL